VAERVQELLESKRSGETRMKILLSMVMFAVSGWTAVEFIIGPALVRFLFPTIPERLLVVATPEYLFGALFMGLVGLAVGARLETYSASL
jgi:hypothetical protein